MSEVVVMADDQTKGSHTPGPWLLNKDAHRHEPGFYGTPSEPGEEEVYTSIALGDSVRLTGYMRPADARLVAAAPELLAALKEMGDWVAGGLQASDQAWPDARCLQHTEEIAARARAAVDKAEGRS